MIEETIHLFRAVPVEMDIQRISQSTMRETIQNGFVFSPNVVGNYTKKELTELTKIVNKEIGLTPQQMNSSFHKSWKKVRDTPTFNLIVEQIVHYFTTYGFDTLGIYSDETIYIPQEKLNVPNFKGKVCITVIKGYTKEEIKTKLFDLTKQSLALAENTVKDIVSIFKEVKITEDEIEEIKNREVKISFYSELNKVPKNPTEFLRYVIFKTTEKTLLIKNRRTIKELKSKEEKNFNLYLKLYKDSYGLENLASIFYRFKPIFLAFKVDENARGYINKIRKLAKKYHKPMKEDFLNQITAKILRGEKIDNNELKTQLLKVNTFRKIRLAYALKYRTTKTSSILYKIRNGTGYAKDFSFTEFAEAERVLNLVIKSIILDISKNVKGKKIYIPENITYALPATEKQFTGNVPSSSYITIPNDIITGVYWENAKESWIDLDLALLGQESGKIGWDSNYKYGTSKVMFSGDLTSAPNGATEHFYIKRQSEKFFIVTLNYYNIKNAEAVEVPIKIILSKGKPHSFGEDYIVDPNYLVAKIKTSIKTPQEILGIVHVDKDKTKFYFSETSIGKSITSSLKKEYILQTLNFLTKKFTNPINLNEVLVKAGAVMVDKPSEANLDLSLEKLEKDTIIKICSNLR